MRGQFADLQQPFAMVRARTAKIDNRLKNDNQHTNTMKKILLLCAMLFVFASTTSAQSVDSIDYNNGENNIFREYELDPSFPGGFAEQLKFIESNMQYPSEAMENGIEGRVYVTFDVDTDGTILNPVILRDIGGGCGEEALRIVRLMPKWEPGKQWTPGQKGGKVVCMRFNMPIKFNIEEYRLRIKKLDSQKTE